MNLPDAITALARAVDPDPETYPIDPAQLIDRTALGMIRIAERKLEQGEQELAALRAAIDAVRTALHDDEVRAAMLATPADRRSWIETEDAVRNLYLPVPAGFREARQVDLTCACEADSSAEHLPYERLGAPDRERLRLCRERLIEEAIARVVTFELTCHGCQETVRDFRIRIDRETPGGWKLRRYLALEED